MYFFSNFIQSFLIFCFCLALSLIIYGSRKTNKKLIVGIATIIACSSFLLSCILSIIVYQYPHTHFGIQSSKAIQFCDDWSCNFWNGYEFYLIVIQYPLTLYVLIIFLHIFQFVCCCKPSMEEQLQFSTEDMIDDVGYIELQRSSEESEIVECHPSHS